MHDDFLRLLSQQFGFDEILSLFPITKGYSSQNFQITAGDGNKYFLKQYASEVQNFGLIQYAEDFFFRGGFPVIQALVSNEGSKYVRYKNRVYSVYPFIDAQIVSSQHMVGQHAFNLGCFLAKMHNYSESNQESYQPYIKKPKPLNKNDILKIYDSVSQLLEKKSNRDELDDSAYLLLQQKVEYAKQHEILKLDIENEKRLLLHGDFNNENVFFDASANIISVFDFDRTFIGYTLYELINSLVIIFFDNFGEQNFVRASKFLDGYKTIRCIDRESFKHTIQYYIHELFYTSLFEEEKYLRKNNRFDDIYKHYLNTLKYFLQKNNFTDFTERIYNYV
jgi:Ser/Thr protein kinase RdoA (MazF antagonist)